MPFKDPEKARLAKLRWSRANKDYFRIRYLTNREQILSQQRKRFATMTLDKKAKIRLASRKSHLKRRYDLTPEEYANLLISQDNKCAICSKDFDQTPCVDHDHKTGKVRGLLCLGCNVALGAWENNIELFYKAMQYLKEKN